MKKVFRLLNQKICSSGPGACHQCRTIGYSTTHAIVSIFTVKDKLKGMMEEFNSDGCAIRGFHTLCDPANQKELSEKILIALDKEWGDEKKRAHAEQFEWANDAGDVIEAHTSTIQEAFE